MEERKRATEAPLTEAEKAEVLVALGPSSTTDAILKTFEKLKHKSMQAADPVLVGAIQKHLKHKEHNVRVAAEDAMAGCDPEYRKKYAVFAKYRVSMHNPIQPPGRLVDATTPLVPGQKILVQGWANNWYSSVVVEVKPDGSVITKGPLPTDQPGGDPFPRNKIQLAHAEVEQSEEVQRLLELAAGGQTMRTWTDSTGQFKIEATMLSIVGNTIKLKRKDGKELELPLDKLSAEDQAFAKKPPKKLNPFE
jgi:hypothetical protein